MAKGETYEIEITASAENRFRREILTYLYIHFSYERVLQIETNIRNEIELIAKNPSRESKDRSHIQRSKDIRFILIKESRNVELKIIYILNKSKRVITIIDFFPTIMHPERMFDA